MMTKFATFEVSEILDVKGSAHQSHTASLDKISDYHDYRTDDGYLYVRIRAISSRVNKNNDGWPSVELAGGQEIFDKHRQASGGGFTINADSNAKVGFSTFIGKPIFVDHNNSNPRRARGVIVDSKLHVEDSKTAAGLDPYYASAPSNHLPPTWVELLLEVDAKQFPKFAKAIRKGAEDPDKGLNEFSMGVDVDGSRCSHCDNYATTPDEYCSHIQAKGAEFDYVTADNERISKKSYEDCYGLHFFEISGVFDAADKTALTQEVIHEAAAPPVAEGFDERGPFRRGMIACPHCRGQGCVNCNNSGVIADMTPNDEGFQTPNEITPHDVNLTIPDRYDLGPRHQGNEVTKLAQPEEPQGYHTTAPEPVDTLRKERVCELCGSDMDGPQCDVCGWDAPPESLQNPDLQKAREHNITEDQAQDALNTDKLNQTTVPPDENVPPPADGEALTYLKARKRQPTSSVITEMRWTPKVNSKVAAKINAIERPVKSPSQPVSDEPQENVTSDQTKPVTSALRTARNLIEAERATKENTMSDETKVAAEPADSDGKAKTRVDVTDVGGVDEGSNEQASKADAQVDVQNKGGTGVEDTSADETDTLPNSDDDEDHGFNKDKNEPAIPTKTFPNQDQTAPVTDKAFPSESSTQKKALDAGPFPPKGEDDAGSDSGATKGTQPADPVGKAEDRVDVLKPVTSPENNSGETKTWSGTDGSGVTRQQEPVTPEPTQSGGVKASHIFNAFKLADVEVDLGLISKEEKFDRVASLENESPEAIQAQLETLSRVRTAGLSKTTSTRQGEVKRVPSFKKAHTITANEEKPEPVDDTTLDSAIFSR